MRLFELTGTAGAGDNPDIRGLTQDSRRVEEGWLFAALPGARQDGRDYIADALRHGASAILVPPGTVVEGTAVIIEDENPRRRLARMAAAFYGRQPETVAAVTGTNGKTSTVCFTRQIWEALGEKAASLGTLGVRGPGMVRSGSLTTPDAVSLHAELADLAASGVTRLAIEASSHGLLQYRLDGVSVSAAGFTNLSHDHLDYHGSMDEYRAAKTRLFADLLREGGAAVLNADTPECAALAGIARARGCRVITYGRAADTIVLKNVTPGPQGQHIEIALDGRLYSLEIPLVGEFQVMNALCALGLVIAGGAPADAAARALEALTGAAGRLQKIPGPAGAAAYIDYAHTPDALENVLKALRPHTPGRLICVFGCGGDRDPHKRPVMGRIAADLADIAICTDDNPRGEDPASIRAQVMAGSPDALREIPGRRAAIAAAADMMRAGDVLLVAGKGHEQGQIFSDRVEPFDDAEETEKAMSNKEFTVTGETVQ